MFEFCAAKGIAPMVETMKLSQVGFQQTCIVLSFAVPLPGGCC
jgi:hypothetical protein